MALDITTYSLNLDINNPNCKMYDHLMQGNCNKSTNKGTDVMAPDGSDYDITIDAGKIKIPVSDVFTIASGINRLTLKDMALIEDIKNGVVKDTAEEIRDKLESLQPGNQFSYNNLDDKPVIPDIKITFASDLLTVQQQSAICVQSLDKDSCTGEAYEMYKTHTGHNLAISHKYYGTNNMSFRMALQQDAPMSSVTDFSQLMGNGLFFSIGGTTNVGIVQKKFMIDATAQDVEPKYSIGKKYTQSDTKDLIGKKMHIAVKSYNTTAYQMLIFLKWISSAKAPIPKVSDDLIDVYNMGTGADYEQTYTVPADAKQIAFIIVAAANSTNYKLELLRFDGSVIPSFNLINFVNMESLWEKESLLTMNKQPSLKAPKENNFDGWR